MQLSESNATTVVLYSLGESSSGRYSCEVSLDAPTFRTQINSARLNVVGKRKIIIMHLKVLE